MFGVVWGRVRAPLGRDRVSARDRSEIDHTQFACDDDLMVGFSVYDEMHAHSFGSFATEEQAVDALCRLATIPWGVEPNIPPCGGGQNGCGRLWGILSAGGMRPMLEVSPTGRRWLDEASSRQTRWRSRRQRVRHAVGGADDG